jgi:hypothetical protein
MKEDYPLNDLIKAKSIERNVVAGYDVGNEECSFIRPQVIIRIQPATDVPSTTCVGYSLFSF